MTGLRTWVTGTFLENDFMDCPLPFYPCEKCGHLTVVGSKTELAQLGGDAVNALSELHRPWIDDIKIKCPVCGESVSKNT